MTFNQVLPGMKFDKLKMLFRRFHFFDDERTIFRTLLFAGGAIYLLMGILYFKAQLDGTQLLMINFCCGLTFFTVAFLSFFSRFVKANLRTLFGIMLYLVMLEGIAEAVSVKFEVNTTVGLIMTYFMCGLAFRSSRQLYIFLIASFTMLLGSMNFFEEDTLNKGVIIAVFFSQGLVTAIALGSKLNVQEKLRRSNDLFKLIFNDSTDANFLTDINSLEIKDCNNKAVQMFEVADKNELVGKQNFKLQLNPMSEAEMKQIRTEIKESWGWSRELEFQTQNGKRMWGNLEARVVPHNNKPHLLVRISDITEKKRMELLLLAEKMVLEMAYQDSDLQNTFRVLLQFVEELTPEMTSAIMVTDKEERKLTWLAASGLPTQLLRDLPSLPVSGSALPCGKSAALRTAVNCADITAENFNSLFVEKFSKYGFSAISSYPIISESNNLIGTYCVFFKTNRIPTSSELEIIERSVSLIGLITEKDNALTDNKRALEELKVKNKELVKINSEIDSFVYSTSHDLRAPLMNVAGLIDLAEMQIEAEEPKMYFGLMKESIYKLDDTIKEIIEYYRNKKVEVSLGDVDLAKLAKDSFNSFRFIDEAKEMEVVYDIDTNAEFYSDPKRISVILNNLISNAIKFRDRSKPHSFLHIRSIVTEDRGVISVKDNGIGIEKKHLEKIFGMFYRGTSSTNGSGLGLYILKEVVEKLNGKIKVESEIGEGTTFTVEIPNHLVSKNKKSPVYV